MKRAAFGAVFFGLVGVGGVEQAAGSFHFMQIEQVIGGVNGDTSAQAIQLRMRSLGQNLVAQGRVIVRDAGGANPILVIDMTSNVPNGAGGDNVLIASDNFLSKTTPTTVRNFPMTNLIPPSYFAAGTLTFEDDFGTIYWRLSWGGAGYTGPGTGDVTNDPDGNFNPPYPGPLPSTNLQALRFTGTASALSTNNAAQYALSASPAVFRNNQRNSFTLTLPAAVGACCNDGTGNCTEGETQASCEGNGRRYGGDNSTCATINPPCVAPGTGACCQDGTGVCEEGVTQATCEGSGRRYGGDNSTCATINPPCEGPGACCIHLTGECIETLTETECSAVGGLYGGLGSTCATLAPPCQSTIAISLATVASGLVAPVHVTHAGDGSGRLFIADQAGLIRIVDNTGALLNDPFLDIRDRMITPNPGFDERGLLGLVFHPDYETNGRFFVRYSAPRTGFAGEPCFGTSRGCSFERLSEYLVSGDPNVGDPTSEIILIEIVDPQFNHNSGTVAFGADGMLYMSMGDGGGAHDGLAAIPPQHGPIGNGQAVDTLLGKMLRIDVDTPPPPAAPYVNEITAETPGSCLAESASRALGAPDHPAATALGSPGEGGSWTLDFGQAVVRDGAGADLRFWQGGEGAEAPPGEQSIVSVSEDCRRFVQLSPNLDDVGGVETPPASGVYAFDFDLSGTGLNAVRCIRIDDVLDGVDGAGCDGSDIDAVEALNFTAVPYSVPADNPFVGVQGLDEIWAYGFRNPFTFFFDHGPGGDGKLYLGDVGQELFEELDIVVRGGNYGWVLREGLHCFDPLNPTIPPSTCPTTGTVFGDPLIDPVLEYLQPLPCATDADCAPYGVGCGSNGLCLNEGGISIIVGQVYRGSRFPALVGRLVFGDFAANFGSPSGRIYYTDISGAEAFERRQFFLWPDNAPLGRFVKGFGEDEAGEVYLCSSTVLAPTGTSGTVHRITAPLPGATGLSPRYLQVVLPNNPSPFGLVVTPDCPSGTPMYVGAPSGPENLAVLVAPPAQGAFLDSAGWGGVVRITGAEIVPLQAYTVQMDSGTPGNPSLSDSVGAVTQRWGDVAGAFQSGAWSASDGSIDITRDTVAILDAFSNRPGNPGIARADLIGPSGVSCLPNRNIGIIDAVMSIDAFRGISFAGGTGCLDPCP